MARDGLRSFAGAALALAAALAASATAAPPGPVADAPTTAQLAVQRALQEGRDQIRAGNFRAAVFILEREIPRINGNRDYLRALAEAYRGLLRDLSRDGRSDEVARYQERLDLLDPAPALGRQASSTNPPPTATAAVAVAALPAVPVPAKAAVTARGQSEEQASSDPFSAANGRRASPAAAAAERADAEFRGKNYAAALRLYEEAARGDRAALADSRDRWAYCKLWGVTEALNQPDPRPAELEREVKQALSLAPRLKSVGEDLLRKIADKQGAAVAVRHTGRQGEWEVAETTNFRVFHNQTRETAERAARLAEATRTEMTRKWFADDSGTWQPRCDVYLYATAEDYVKATGAPQGSPGHSYMEQDGPRVTVRRMHLRCDDPNMLVGVLPHETTHVVLCGRFGRHQVPRWADEGMAVLAEPRDRVERHLHNLPQHARDRQLFPVGQLMKLADYPDPRYVGSFYAESVSLVEFLARREGPRVFSRFLRDGLDGGYEAALERHYHLSGFDELERLWRQEAIGGVTSASAAGVP